jgi:hypothetical protein
MSKDLILGRCRRCWSRGGSPHAGIGYAPVVDGLPQPDPLTGEQKEDIRTFLRHLQFQGADSDNTKFSRQVADKYGPLRDKVRSGDREASAQWNELVSWTNSLQQDALKNQPAALIMLRNISRSRLFSPRFQVAN